MLTPRPLPSTHDFYLSCATTLPHQCVVQNARSKPRSGLGPAAPYIVGATLAVALEASLPRPDPLGIIFPDHPQLISGGRHGFSTILRDPHLPPCLLLYLFNRRSRP